MASNTINIGVDVTSNLSEVNKAAERLRDTLKEAAKVASSINIPSGGSSQRSANQTRTFASASQQASTPRENLDYRTARGIGEVTGAAGRDFAKQAQGLGGLVHVYATFAANIFAVSAAFTALKNAADTTNMIKGLDQLGAASGRNLGQLSKEVVKLTDGAVSLRDAMEATAKATSAGMSNENLKRLAVGAKNASQALGLAMPDALSRLSRGITKLEPELLDELGIFVRVDKAASDYARTLGKPTSALTDFERRTAFAVATLDQLDSKFGSINMDANPYDKILSSLKDMTQSGLELVNKVLTPILNVLSSSPTALAMAMTAVVGILLKQALPALGNFRASLQDAAEGSAAKAASRYADIKNNLSKQAAATKAYYDQAAEAASQAFEKSSAKITESMSKVKGSIYSKDALAIASKNLADITKEDIALLDKLGEKQTNAAKHYRQMSADIKAYNIEAEKYAKKSKEIDADREKQLASGVPKASQILSNRLTTSSYRRDTNSMVAETAATEGFSAAMEKLESRIKKAKEGAATKEFTIKGLDGTVQTITAAVPKIGAFQAGMMRLTGSLAAASVSLSTVMAVAAPWLELLGLIVAGLAILDSKLTSNSKELNALSEAQKSVESSTEALSNVFDRLSKINFLQRFSVENVDAVATAVYELTQSLDTMAEKAESAALATERGPWSKAKNGFADFFDMSIADDAANTMANSLTNMFSKLPDDPKIKKFSQDLSSKLGNIDVTNMKELDNALEKLFKANPESFRQIAKDAKDIGISLKTASSAGVEFKKSLEEGAKKFDDFSNSFIPSDKFSQLGIAISDMASRASIALDKGPAEALTNIKNILSDPKFLNMFPPETIDKLMNYKDSVISMSEGLDLAKQRIEKLREAEEELQKVISEGDRVGMDTGAEGLQLAQIKKSIAGEINLQAKIEVDSKDAISAFKSATIESFAYGAQIVGKRLEADWGKVGTAVANTVVGVLGNTKEANALRAQNEQRQLASQASLLQSQQELIKSNYYVAETYKIEGLVKILQGGIDIKTGEKLTKEQRTSTEAELKQRQDSYAAIASGNPRGLATKMSKNFGEYSKEAISLAQSLEGIAVQIAGIADQVSDSKLKEELADISTGFTKQKEALDSADKLLTLEKSSISSIKEEGDLINLTNIARLNSIDYKLLENKQSKEMLVVMEQVAKLEKIISDSRTTADQKAKASSALSTLQATTVAQTYIAQQIERGNAKIDAEIKLQTASNELTKVKLKLAQDDAKAQREITKEQQNRTKILDDLGKSSGLMSEVDYAKSAAKIKMETLKMEADERMESLNATKLEMQMKADIIQQQYALMKAQAVQNAQYFEGLAAGSSNPEQKKAYESASVSAMSSIVPLDSSAESAKAASDLALEGVNRQIERAQALNAEKEKTAQLEIRIAEIMAQQADRLSNINNLAQVFGDTSNNASNSFVNFATGISNLLTGQDQYNTLLAASDEKIAKLAETAKAYQSSMTGEEDADTINKAIKAESDLADAKNQRQKLEDKSNAKTLSDTKKLFKEKTVAYRLISAMEKVQMAWKLASTAKEMVLEGQKVAQAVMSAGTITAAKTQETVAGAAASTASAGSGDPYTGIARVIAMLALMAIPLAMVGKSSGGASAPSAEQLQAVQGTNMDYVNGQLVDNGGGALGDANKVSKDIADSLEYIESHTNKTLQYNNAMLESLQAIEVNTANFVASLYSSGVLGLKSPFGTTESTSSRPGFIGIGSGKSSTSIEDTGVKIAGALGDLIKGIGQYLVYETVKRTSSNSGLWGLFSSSSTSVNTSYLRLEDDLVSQIQGIMESARVTINTFGTKLGTRSVSELNSILDNTAISLDVSTKGLTGEEALQALQAELGIAMNQLVRTAYPYLKDFQKLGEGLLTTLTRVVTDMDTVNLMFEQVGVNIQDMLLPWTLVDTSTSEAAIRMQANADAYNTAVSNIANSTADFLDNTVTYADTTRELYSEWGPSGFEQTTSTVQERLEKALNKTFTNTADFIGYLTTNTITQITQALQYTAPELLTQVMSIKNSIEGLGSITASASTIAAELEVLANSNITSNLEKYKYLVDRFGDIDKFTESMQFFVDNFTTTTDKNTVLISKVRAEMERLGYASVDTREEFTNLVKSLDVMTESGADTLKALSNVQEGFSAMAEVMESLADKAGLSADAFASVLTDGLLGKISNADIGTKIADTIEQGITKTIADASVTEITSAISSMIITPVVTAIATGTYTTTTISEMAIDEIISKASQAATVLGRIFSSAEFKEGIQKISTDITEAITSITSVVQITTNSISKLLKTYESKLKTANDKIISVLKNQVSQLDNVKSKFQDFANSLRKFADSLLVGAQSPLTPAEQYGKLQTSLLDTFNKAMSGDESAFADLQSASQAFLDASRGYYASSEAYTNDFNFVQDILKQAASKADSIVTETERQISLAQDQLTALGYIDETTKSIEQLLQEAYDARAKVEEENTTLVADTLVSGFTSLDSNVDGLLTRQELNALGLASDSELSRVYSILDSNGDGNISALEALQGATDGTTYAVQALEPILKAMRDGVISLAQARSAASALDQANAAIGQTTNLAGSVNSPEVSGSAGQQYTQAVRDAYGTVFGIASNVPDSATVTSIVDRALETNTSISDIPRLLASIYYNMDSSSEAMKVMAGYFGQTGNSPVSAVNGWIRAGYQDVLGVPSTTPTDETVSTIRNQLLNGTFAPGEYYTKLAEYYSVNGETDALKVAATSWLSSHPNFVTPYTASSTYSAFAGGGMQQGGVSLVGEQGPELRLDGPARYWSFNQTRSLLSPRESNDQELLDEIRKLNEKIASLEQTVARGDAMNIAATERNTQQVSSAVNTSSSKAAYASKLSSKVTLS